MNTKGMKFLAVLAVLAMAFATFAVIAPAETDDASGTANPVAGGETDAITGTSTVSGVAFTLVLGNSNTEATVTGTTAGFKLTGSVVNDASKYADSNFPEYNGFAFAWLQYTSASTYYLAIIEDSGYKYEETSSSNIARTVAVDGKYYRSMNMGLGWANDALGLPIPQDGTDITIKIYASNSAWTATTYAAAMTAIGSMEPAFTLTIGCSELITKATLGSNNIGYNQDGHDQLGTPDWKYDTKKHRDSAQDNLETRITLLEADNKLLHQQLDSIGTKLDKIIDQLCDIKVELAKKEDKE